MANEVSRDKSGSPEEKKPSGQFESDDLGALTGGSSNGDLSNLPPLSDFESTEAVGPDSNLPPLAGRKEESPDDRLPPISDIPVETPVPTGGAIKPTPPGFESGRRLDTPTLQTPVKPSPVRGGTGFQDLAADSDFTPETPEIGPGPESDLETPMFDSAFGSSSDLQGGLADSPVPDTSAPTQAMETPIFAAPEDTGFEAPVFGSVAEPSFAPGTPVPDFSPDTAAPVGAPTPGPEVVARPTKAARPSLVKTALVAVITLVVGAAGGIFYGPKLSETLTFIPNQARTDLAAAQEKLAAQQSQLDRLIKQQERGEAALSPEDIDRLIAQKEQLMGEIEQYKAEHTALSEQLNAAKTELTQVENDLEAKNEEYVQAEQEYEELLNRTSIVRARREGLSAEVDRLQELLGGLEEANSRSQATKASLESDIGQLAILVRESIPLTPEKYSHAQRVAAVEELQNKVKAARWVAPELLEEYTTLYLNELEIAKSREYFYAKIPVADRFGTRTEVWAECLMNGNWSVYYRTLDGLHIGSYMNTAQSGSPTFEFVEDFSPSVKKQVEEEIIAKRVPGWEEKLRLLAGHQQITQRKSRFQEIFDSM